MDLGRLCSSAFCSSTCSTSRVANEKLAELMTLRVHDGFRLEDVHFWYITTFVICFFLNSFSATRKLKIAVDGHSFCLPF